MSTITKERAQKELYTKVEQQAHSLRGNSREYQAVTGMCPVNVIEMQAQKIQALLDELEAADEMNKHLELAIRKAEGCSEALRRKAEAAEERIAELEGELEVAQHDLSDTEDAMHIWADRAKEAEGSLISHHVAYAPKGHIDRYLKGSNSGCWVYGNPTGEDDDALYMAAPNNAQHFDRNTICEKVHIKCSCMPGATFYNAAEFALDEVERAAAAGKGA